MITVHGKASAKRRSHSDMRTEFFNFCKILGKYLDI